MQITNPIPPQGPVPPSGPEPTPEFEPPSPEHKPIPPTFPYPERPNPPSPPGPGGDPRPQPLRFDGRVGPAILIALCALLPGCEAIVGIFKAGAWVGAIAVIVVVGIVVGAASLFRK